MRLLFSFFSERCENLCRILDSLSQFEEFIRLDGCDAARFQFIGELPGDFRKLFLESASLRAVEFL